MTLAPLTRTDRDIIQGVTTDMIKKVVNDPKVNLTVTRLYVNIDKATAFTTFLNDLRAYDPKTERGMLTYLEEASKYPEDKKLRERIARNVYFGAYTVIHEVNKKSEAAGPDVNKVLIGNFTKNLEHLIKMMKLVKEPEL